MPRRTACSSSNLYPAGSKNPSGQFVRAAAGPLYRAIGRRGRNGIHVYWTSLEPEEQAIYAKLLRAEMHNCWHRARELAGLTRLLESNCGIGGRMSHHDALWAIPKRSKEPAGDIDTVAADSLKALDPEQPIREADIV